MSIAESRTRTRAVRTLCENITATAGTSVLGETPMLEFEKELLPENIVEELAKMIEIEQKVIANQMMTCLEMPDHLAKVLFQRMSVNAMTIGNLSLSIADMKRRVVAEIDLTEQKLADAQ